MDFLPFYGGNDDSNKILCVDAAGRAILYDAGSAATVETLPSLHKPKASGPVALSVASPGGAHDPDALYVLDRIRGSFEALVYIVMI
jgi:hypothetical protein